MNSKIQVFKLYYQNIRSLKNKIIEFQALTQIFEYDIIFLTESWLNSDILDSELCTKYILVRNDRKSRGGGVLIGLKPSIKFTKLFFNSNLEYICIKLQFRPINIFILLIYLPPPVSIDDLNLFYDLVSQIFYKMMSKDRIIILGDFNIPTYLQSISCSKSDCINDISSEFNLKQKITFPTRENSMLDLLFSNLDISVYKTPQWFTSDHCAVESLLEIPCSHSTSSYNIPTKKLNLYKINYDELTSLMNNINWSSIFSNKDIQTITDDFYSTIFNNISKCCPLKETNKNLKNPN